MIRYPIFTYPDLFTQNIDIISYITECMGSAPSEPCKPTIEYPTKGCLIGLVFYIIVAVVISGGLPLSTTLPFGFASAVILWIVYFIISQIEFYKRLKVYNDEYNLYLQDIQLYNNRVELKQKDIELLQKSGDFSWKKQLINERLKTLTFKLSSGYGKKGASEVFFIQHLKEFFNCQIFQNSPIFCKEVGHKYYPDIGRHGQEHFFKVFAIAFNPTIFQFS